MAENLYSECRKRAAAFDARLKNQAGAADVLGISEASLANYERGATKNMPAEMVVLMAKTYNAPELKYHYCKKECPIGCFIPLATTEQTIEATAVHILDSMRPDEMDGCMRKLLRIAADGKITQEEEKELSPIMNALNRVCGAISELRIIAERSGAWNLLND